MASEASEPPKEEPKPEPVRAAAPRTLQPPPGARTTRARPDRARPQPGRLSAAPQKRQTGQRTVSPRRRPGNRRRRPKRALCGSASYSVALALPGFLQHCCALPGRPLLPMARPARTTTRSQLRRRRRCAAAAPPPHPPNQTGPPADLSLSLGRDEPKHRSLPQVEFKPLVQLDEVKTASGEEEEEVLFKM